MSSATEPLVATVATPKKPDVRLTNVRRCKACGGLKATACLQCVTPTEACQAVLDALSGLEWDGWTGRAQQMARAALKRAFGAEWVAEYERLAVERGAGVDGGYCCCGEGGAQ